MKADCCFDISFACLLPDNFCVATATKLQVGCLILHQQSPCSAGMRLVTAETTDLFNLGFIKTVWDVRYGMVHNRVSQSSRQLKVDDAGEIVLRQPYLPVENPQ